MDIFAQLVVNSLIAGSIYALISSGLSLTYGLLRILNFSHGHVLMLGAYMFYFAFIDKQISLWPAIAFTVLFMSLFSILSFKIFVSPLLPYSQVLPFVATLALATMLEALVSIFFGVNVLSLSAGQEITSVSIGSAVITPLQILIIFSAILTLIFLAFIIHSTSLGRKIRALSANDSASEAIGVNKKMVFYGLFTFSNLLAAFSGVLVGFETNLLPTMGNAYTIKAFAAMILGGLGNIWGTVCGAYILGFIENFSIGLEFGSYSLPAGYKDAFAFVIILLVLLVRPQGLFNRKQRSA